MFLFFILRAISDSANGEANFDFDEFLNSSAKISSNYLVKIVDELIKNSLILFCVGLFYTSFKIFKGFYMEKLHRIEKDF